MLTSLFLILQNLPLVITNMYDGGIRGRALDSKYIGLPSGVATGVWGQIPLTFCQDGARDFYKTEEKMTEGG